MAKRRLIHLSLLLLLLPSCAWANDDTRGLGRRAWRRADKAGLINGRDFVDDTLLGRRNSGEYVGGPAQAVLPAPTVVSSCENGRQADKVQAADLTLITPAPLYRRQDNGQIQALSNQLQQLSQQSRQVSQASQQLSQSSQQLSQSLQQAQQQLSQTQTRLASAEAAQNAAQSAAQAAQSAAQSAAQAASAAAASAASAVSAASTNAANAAAAATASADSAISSAVASASSSAAAAIAANLASVTSSAQSSLASALAIASNSVNVAMSSAASAVQVAQADTSAVRVSTEDASSRSGECRQVGKQLANPINRPKQTVKSRKLKAPPCP
jgi:hypothetical protein